MITCSPFVLHIMFIADVLISDILALEIDVLYMIFCPQNSLRFNLRTYIFQKFPGDMPPDPLAFACYAC